MPFAPGRAGLESSAHPAAMPPGIGSRFLASWGPTKTTPATSPRLPKGALRPEASFESSLKLLQKTVSESNVVVNVENSPKRADVVNVEEDAALMEELRWAIHQKLQRLEKGRMPATVHPEQATGAWEHSKEKGEKERPARLDCSGAAEGPSIAISRLNRSDIFSREDSKSQPQGVLSPAAMDKQSPGRTAGLPPRQPKGDTGLAKSSKTLGMARATSLPSLAQETSPESRQSFLVSFASLQSHQTWDQSVPAWEMAARRARGAFERGDYGAAVELYSEAIEGSPSAAGLLLCRSVAQQRKGSFVQALSDAKRAVRLDPAWPKAHYRLGLTHRSLGNLAAAVASFRTALELDRNPSQKLVALIGQAEAALVKGRKVATLRGGAFAISALAFQPAAQLPEPSVSAASSPPSCASERSTRALGEEESPTSSPGVGSLGSSPSPWSTPTSTSHWAARLPDFQTDSSPASSPSSGPSPSSPEGTASAGSIPTKLSLTSGRTNSDGVVLHYAGDKSASANAMAKPEVSSPSLLAATGSLDGSVQLWSVPGWTCKAKARAPNSSSAVTKLLFSPNGCSALLAVAMSDNTVCLWKVERAGGDSPTAASAESAVDKEGAEAQQGDTPSGELTATFSSSKVPSALKTDLPVHEPDGTFLTLHCILSGHTAPITAMSFSSNTGFLVTASGDGTARLWGTADGAELRCFGAPSPQTSSECSSPLTAVTLSSNDALLAASSENGVTRVWETGSGSCAHCFEGELGTPIAARFFPSELDPGSHLLALCHSDEAMGQGLLHLWLVQQEGSSVAVLKRSQVALPEHIVAVDFGCRSHGAVLAGVTLSGGSVCVYNMQPIGQSGQCLRILQEGAATSLAEWDCSDVVSVQLSPGAQRLAGCARDGAVKVWSVGRGELESQVDVGFHGVPTAQWSGDGLFLATLAGGQGAQIWRGI